MEFCDKCGGLMIPKKSGKRIILICRKCGKKKKAKEKKFKISVSTEKKVGKIIVVEERKRVDVLPKTQMTCPKCGNDEAYWWMQQTRAADEAPTRFYKCTKCGHVWREYE
jgi:DNA-directed RNA polymerase subunit M